MSGGRDEDRPAGQRWAWLGLLALVLLALGMGLGGALSQAVGVGSAPGTLVGAVCGFLAAGFVLRRAAQRLHG